MFILLLSVVLAVFLAIFATQNTNLITVNIGNFVLNVPTYIAIFVPLIIGLIVAFILHIIRDLSQKLTISEQNDRIKNLKIQLAEITKKAHKLELENTKLKSENGEEDENSI